MNLKEYLQKAFKRKRLEKELYSLSDRELSDIGISRCDIRRIVKEHY